MESGGAMNTTAKGGGEVRRVNIIYFLSRDGRIEHPHLIRVHHHHRNGGIHLRDVKRWLSELRGKDMPESFAWSYKRRYKTGYLWQDLMDDELITPVSDNEYVLKGSFLPPGKLPPDAELVFPTSPGAVDVQKAGEELKPAPQETLEIDELDGGDLVSPKPPPRLDQESPPSAQPDQPAEPPAAARRSAVFKIDLAERRREEVEEEVREEKKELAAAAAAAAEDGRVSGGSGRRSYSKRRASHVLRSILTCGRVETNDSALLPVGRRRGEDGGPHSRASMAVRPRQHKPDPTKNDSRKNRATGSGSGGKSSRREGERPVSAAYKPVAAPNCSQCGKGFNPEKLHSHMKSCRALKRRGNKNGSANPERMHLTAESRSEDFSKYSASGLLT